MVRIAWIGCVAFVLAALTAAEAFAQSPVCVDLQRQYLAAGGGSSGGGNVATLSRQVAEYQGAARAHGCAGRLFFGPRPSPHCPQIMGTLGRLQQQLAAAGPARRGGNINQIRAWMSQYGCSIPQGTAGRNQWAAGARTLCVRLCDGYYFPISTGGTRRDRVKVEAEACQSMFAEPDQAALFLQRAQDDVATAVSVDGKLRYSEQPFAFQYREKFDSACHAQLKSGISALRDRYMDALGEMPQKPATRANLRALADVVPMPHLAPRDRGDDPETVALRAGGFSFEPQVADAVMPPRMRLVGDDFYRDLYDPDLPPVAVVEHRAPLGFDLLGNARAEREAETATQ